MASDGRDAGEGADASARPSVPIVAIGASAGGFEALKVFLEALPDDTGACYVFVQHLDPNHKSMLAELLARFTAMRIKEATESLAAEANTVVLIPPDATLTYADGLFHVQRPAPPRSHRTPIDSLFESLASELGPYGVCVLLSGTGSDGSLGLARVKEAGGLILVQEPGSAKYDGMLRSAVATGFVDRVLAPEDMPGVLIDHFKRSSEEGQEDFQNRMTASLVPICNLLRARTGHEFREYKEGTLIRRINRRMQILKLYEVEDYITRLREDGDEVNLLLKELLISVTGFFRDPAAFEHLMDKAVGPMIARLPSGATFRAWVPGCATGEEAYTLAMLIHQCAENQSKSLKVQIFATDIDERALESARRGSYADESVQQVPEPYRQRYFRADSGRMRIVDELREMCVFSAQNLIKDPPFSRLDLLSCRNLMIYLKPALQAHVIPVFHYALKPDGILLLGPSENVTKHSKLFESLDSKWRIFKRRETDEKPAFPMRSLHADRTGNPVSAPRPSPREPAPPLPSVSRAERYLLDRLGPAYVVIDGDRNVLYTGGRIERFLHVARGAPTRDVLALIRPELRMEARAVIHRAQAENAPAQRDEIILDDGGQRRRIRIECAPVEDEAKGTCVLTFHDCGLDDREPVAIEHEDDASVEALERELAATKEYLQSTAEELESSNEELKSANEELMSMNEELQSSNEELETSKEELQSVNEELETVNAELAAKVDELNQNHADLQNLLESIQIATLFLDNQLRVRRFTPVAKDIFHLIDGDVGRSITDITPKIDEADTENLFRQVLQTGRRVEKPVRLRGNADSAFMMRVLPYRGKSGEIDGVVAVFVDISEVEAARSAAERRAEQQDYLARLAGRLIDREPFSEFSKDVPREAAHRLNAEFGKILRTRPGKGDFQLVTQHGFDKAGDNAVVAGGTNSQAGFTLQSSQPVIVMDLAKESRFRGPNLLTDHGVSSGISTVINGPDGGWGVLGIHSTSVRSFTRDDIKFIEAIAGILSSALQMETAWTAVKESEERLSEAMQAGKLGVFDYDPVNGKLDWDHRLRELWGVPPGAEVTYKTFRDGLNPEDIEATEAAISGSLDPDGDGQYETNYRVINARTGDERWIRAAGRATFVDGVARRLVGTVMDITERRQAEDHIQFLMSEVNHRAKNLLTVVQSIARQTSQSSDPATFSEDLDRRLAGLAASQDLIIRGDWKLVSLNDLVLAQLSPFGMNLSERFDIEGETLMLKPPAAQGIGMALHELTTNALKYGALSNSDGHIYLAWTLKGPKKNPVFSMQWKERNGPETRKPEASGFGAIVIDEMAAASVGGEVKLSYPKQGVEWHLSAPAENVLIPGE